MSRPGGRFRELVKAGPVILPGTVDALTAMLAEQAGFDAVYVSGAGTATSVAGVPDIGLITLTEMATVLRYVCSAASVPVIADADTGYGGVLAVFRTVRLYEDAGVAGLHIEDQVDPKRCGHLQGKRCIRIEEMVGKIRAAVDARRDPDLMIIGRTDARGPEGFDAAVQRGLAYRAAGADAIFPEALQTREEFAEYAHRVSGLLLANMTEFGLSPLLTATDLFEMGYGIVLYPVSAQRVATRVVRDFFESLIRNGSQAEWMDRMMTRSELYQLVRYNRYSDQEDTYTRSEATGAPIGDSESR